MHHHCSEVNDPALYWWLLFNWLIILKTLKIHPPFVLCHLTSRPNGMSCMIFAFHILKLCTFYSTTPLFFGKTKIHVHNLHQFVHTVSSMQHSSKFLEFKKTTTTTKQIMLNSLYILELVTIHCVLKIKVFCSFFSFILFVFNIQKGGLSAWP